MTKTEKRKESVDLKLMDKVARENEGKSDIEQFLAYEEALESKYAEDDYFDDLAEDEKEQIKKDKQEEIMLNRITCPGSAGHAARVFKEDKS